MPELQTLDVPGIFQAAEQVKSSRLTNRVNELKLENLQRKAAREETKQGVFQRATSPTGEFDPQAAERGLFQAGMPQEAFDFQKVQLERQQAEATLKNTIGSGEGIDLENTIKRNDILGRASLGVTQAYLNLIDQGVSPIEAAQRTGPLYKKVLSGLQDKDIDISSIPTEFDPNTTLAAVLSSKTASDTFNQLKTQAATEKPKVSAGADEVSLEIFDTSFRKATKEQRKVINAVRQNRKRSVSAASGLEAEKAKQKLLVTGKGAGAAGKATGIKVGIGNIGLLRDLILDKKGDIKRLNVLKSKLGVGVGRMINFLTSDTLSSRLRLESGAVISKEELDEMAKRFTVSLFPPDSKELVALKFDKLEEFLRTADNFVDPSGIFNFAEFNRNFPTDLGKPIEGEAAPTVRRFNPATGRIE